MISVCMASHNGEKFISQQIESILKQLSDSDELIISDDGSTDETIDIINSFHDKRIKLYTFDNIKVKSKSAKGFYYASANFENALKQAKGDYIFLSDQDDIFIENKFNVFIDLLHNFDCVMSNADVIDEKNELIQKAYLKNIKISHSLIINIIKIPFVGCCMGFKRNVLEASLPFPRLCVGHDLWIGCIAARKFKFKYIEESFTLHRKHGINVSNITTKSRNSLFFKISYRITLLFKLFIHFIRGNKNDR